MMSYINSLVSDIPAGDENIEKPFFTAVYVVFDRLSLKSEARSFLEKSTRSPCFERPFKLQRHLVRLLAISKQIANAAMKIHRAVGIGST
jgi:hypothetical protein